MSILYMTHVFREHVRGAQLEYFMKKLEQFLKRQFRERFSSVPLVLAADLNTLPGVGAYRQDIPPPTVKISRGMIMCRVYI